MSTSPAGPGPAARDVADALANAHAFFENNSGWAPPDDETLADWVADGMCRAPDECLVDPRGWCEHGLASWWLVLADLGDVDVPDLSCAAELPGAQGGPGHPPRPVPRSTGPPAPPVP